MYLAWPLHIDVDHLDAGKVSSAAQVIDLKPNVDRWQPAPVQRQIRKRPSNKGL